MPPEPALNMPQYNAPTLVTSMAPADIILFWSTALGANRTIEFSDLLDSIADNIPHKDSVSEISSNVTLNGSYQFVVCNSPAGIDVTLPPAVNYPGQKYRIAAKGAGTVSVLASGTDGIAADGALGPSTSIDQYNTRDFESDGVDTWFVV